MNHYVLTRSTYAPEVDIDVNHRRLDLMRAIAARSLASQTAPFLWLVALHPEDPFRDERAAVVGGLGGIVFDFVTTPVNVPWSSNVGTHVQQLAASAYFAPWQEWMEPGRRLQTRLDDDDALTPDHIERVQATAKGLRGRNLIVTPTGLWTDGRLFRWYRREMNMFQTLLTPSGDDLCIYSFGHRHAAEVAPTRVVPDDEVGWLYLRHPDAITGDKPKVHEPLTDDLRARFDIDWTVIA